MEFGLPGPLRVWDGPDEVQIPGAKHGALLTLLLVHRGQVLAPDMIVDELRGEALPQTPSNAPTAIDATDVR